MTTEEKKVIVETNIRAVSIISKHILESKSLEVVDLLTKLQSEILNDDRLITF